jgi:hypothetical protein
METLENIAFRHDSLDSHSGQSNIIFLSWLPNDLAICRGAYAPQLSTPWIKSTVQYTSKTPAPSAETPS